MKKKQNVGYSIDLAFIAITILTFVAQMIYIYADFNLTIKNQILAVAAACWAISFIASVVHKSIYFKRLTAKVVNKDNAPSVTLLDIYGILGIPPQYNPDGSLKDIFDLLKIKPIYDADGNRQLTIYELLGINPYFDVMGNEKPTVLRVKNRVNSFIKLAEKPEILQYVTKAQKLGKVAIIPQVEESKDTKTPAPAINIKKAAVIKPKVQKKPAGRKPQLNFAEASKGLVVNTFINKTKKIETNLFQAVSSLNAAIKSQLQPKPQKIQPVAPKAAPKQPVITQQAPQQKTDQVVVTNVTKGPINPDQAKTIAIVNPKVLTKGNGSFVEAGLIKRVKLVSNNSSNKRVISSFTSINLNLAKPEPVNVALIGDEAKEDESALGILE